MTRGSKVLILSRHSKAEVEFVNNIKKNNPGLDITLKTYLDVDIFINKVGTTIKLHDEKVDLASFDLVYFKTTAKYPDIAASIASHLNKRGLKFIDKAAEFYEVTSKIYQNVVFSDSNIKVPATVFILRERLKNSYELIKEALGSPFILKDNHGNKGKLNYLIANKQSFDVALEAAENLEAELIAQEYIENDGDYRLLVFGDKIYLAIHRINIDSSTHLNNISSGGSFKQIALNELPKAVIDQTIKAAKVLQRQIAGVDMVKKLDSGDWYCLEVNEGPQISSGVLVPEKQQAFAKFLEDYL